jgi:hypothetical protein
VLLGGELDARAVDALRVVRRALGVSAVDRADGACHSAARAVIDAGLNTTRVDGDDLVQADCIVCIGDPAADNPQLDVQLLTARATGVPVLALGDAQPLSASAAISLPADAVAAFMQAATKELLSLGAVDRGFINASTVGFGEFLADLEADAVPASHRDALGPELRAFVEYIRNAEHVAIVWQPTTAPADAMLARAIIGLLLVRGSVGRPGAGLCVVGPVAERHPEDCCAVRSSGLNTGIGPVPKLLGVVERAQLGDLELLITVGCHPFAGVDRALEREALEGVALLIHVGTAGSDVLPVQQTPVLVLPGASADRLHDLLAAINPEVVPETFPDTTGLTPVPRAYAFVARVVDETRRYAS